MSKKGKIGKIYFSSKIREGGNMSKIGKKGNVANYCSEKIKRTPVIRVRKVRLQCSKVSPAAKFSQKPTNLGP